MTFKRFIIIFLVCLSTLDNDLRSTSFFGKTQSTGMMLLEKLKSSPLACALLATMSIKCCIDKVVKFDPIRPFVKSGIKGASYAALSYYMFKNNYTKTAFGIAGFGLMDSIATLPISSLSCKVRSFMKDFNQEILSLTQPIKNKTRLGKIYMQIDDKFIEACNLCQAYKVFIPTVSIAQQVQSINDGSLEKELYQQMQKDCYERSCSFSQLKKIFNYHILMNEKRKSVKAIVLNRMRKKYDEIRTELQPRNSYEIIHKLGIRDITQSYFLEKLETANTWNRLPVEIMTYIFSFLSPGWHDEMRLLINYSHVLAAWKQDKNHIIPRSPIIATFLYKWARLLKGATITVENDDISYGNICWNGWNLKIPLHYLQIILKIMQNSDFITYKGYQVNDKNKEQKEYYLSCLIKMASDDTFIFRQSVPSTKYIPVKIVKQRNTYSLLETTVTTFIKLTPSQDKEEITIKLSKDLYDALILLSGRNYEVELVHIYREFDTIDKSTGLTNSDLLLIQEIKKDVALILRIQPHQVIKYLVDRLAKDSLCLETTKIYDLFFDEKGLLKIYNFNEKFVNQIPKLPNIEKKECTRQRLLINELAMFSLNTAYYQYCLLGLNYILRTLQYTHLDTYCWQLVEEIVNALSGQTNKTLLFCTHFAKIPPLRYADVEMNVLETVCLLLKCAKKNNKLYEYVIKLNFLWGQILQENSDMFIELSIKLRSHKSVQEICEFLQNFKVSKEGLRDKNTFSSNFQYKSKAGGA